MPRGWWGVAALLLIGAVISGSPGRALAVDDPWAIGLSAGYFMPATEGWEDNYDRRGGWIPSFSAGYAVAPQWSIAVEVAYFRASSFARGALTNEPSIEEQRLTLVPSTVGVEYRAVFDPAQWIVPFASAGYRRVSYRLEVGQANTVRGAANGVVGRGGVDILLNSLDPSAASGLREDYGVARSYFRIEAQWTKANADSISGEDIDLGGTTFLAGLRFEF